MTRRPLFLRACRLLRLACLLRACRLLFRACRPFRLACLPFRAPGFRVCLLSRPACLSFRAPGFRALPLAAGSCLSALLLASCDATIHEYPHASLPDSADVVLQLRVDRSRLRMYRQVTYTNDWQRSVTSFPADSLAPPYPASDGLSLRVIVDVMQGRMPQSVSQVRPGDRLCRRVLYEDKDAPEPQDTIRLRLPAGDYYVLAWADYADPATAPASTFYATDTLTAVTTRFDTYPMTSLDRSCAAGQRQFALGFSTSREGEVTLTGDTATAPPAPRTVPVRLSRPVGLFKVYATDYPAFVRLGLYLRDITVRCRYKMFVGAGFNVFTDEPNRFIATYDFLTAPMGEDTRTGDEVLIFGDYLFTSPARESNIEADFIFIDNRSGQRAGEIDDIAFPVLRGHETDIRGHFLTGGDKNRDNGGVAIDENFSGEYVIHLSKVKR